MENNRQEHLYTKADLNKAYAQGLESAVAVLEQSFKFSGAARWHLIESLKKKIIEDKISVFKVS
jgi:hypothetical protein